MRQKYNDNQNVFTVCDMEFLVAVPYWDFAELNYDYLIERAYG